MQILVSDQKDLSTMPAEMLILGHFENEKNLTAAGKTLDKIFEQAITHLVRQEKFSGKLGEVAHFLSLKKIAAPHVLLLGLGKKADFTLEKLRRASSAIIPAIQKYKIKKLALALPPVLPKKASVGDAAQALAESLLLSNYQFLEYKKPEKDGRKMPLEELTFVTSQPGDKAKILKGTNRGQILAGAVNYARDLANHPGNVMTPQTLADEAVKLAKQYKLRFKILEKPEMEKLGMNALLGVNMGSALPPKFIILEYNHNKSGAPLVLAGKGITFDSGGISIKPSRNMEEMKFDMAGAASVLGILKACAELKSPAKLVGLIPATENMPSGSALRPGDVVRALNGKTIEVTNTDAEGRMVLADTLAYAARYKPKLVIDFATLTGSVVVALGTEMTAALANNPQALAKLQRAAEISGEKVWPLPLMEEYKEKMKGKTGDIDNVGTNQGAGTITGALFLQEFVSYPWIHLDIAGTAWTTEGRGYNPKGATGVGVRLMMEFLR
ncbi:MAG: leucyl aminopeptidase [Patescibacteria group bacterium]